MMADLEFLREVFKDVRQHIGIGVITKLGLAGDNSCLRVQVNLLPENREIIAYMSFADVYDVTFPGVNELVLVAFADGLPDEAHVIARFPSIDEPLPALARTGHSVKYSRPGKKLYLGSDTKVGLARPAVEPSEPVVLGNVLITALTAFLNAFLNASQIGVSPAGPVFMDPAVRTALLSAMNTYLTTASTNVVSQLVFTERGT